MREIRFRAKDKDGNWQYGYIALVSFVENMHSWRIFNFNNGTKGTPVDPRTKGQYTGLKDKNGVEIYEGDVVGVYDCHNEEYDENESEDNYLISKHTIKYCIDDHYPAFDMSPVWDEELNSLSSVNESTEYYMKVLGNQFENPELLGV